MKHTFLRYSLLLSMVSFLLFSCSNEFDGKNGIKTVHFPNSELVKQVVGYKDGKRDGPLKEYYRNGNLKISQSYKNDTVTDSTICYYENGNVQYIQYVKNGNKERAWKKFNDQGKLYEEVNYSNDEKEGDATTYSYRSLKLLERKHYSRGMESGKQEYYYPNGKPKAITFISRAEPCIGTEEWDKDGKLINNDFTISAREENKLLLTGKFSIYIKLSDSQPDDEVMVVSDTSSGNCLTKVFSAAHKENEFSIDYMVTRGGFVMEKIKVAAIRKTAMGNTFVKTKEITVAVNNY